jgi:flagellar hook-associated protein 2
MAVSPTKSNTSLGASAIDVAGIVEQLMAIENRPLEKIKTQVEQKNLVISDLGTIKSKLAIFQDALKVFQTPTTFNNLTASSSDTSVITATAGSRAIKGNHSVTVTSLATATRYAMTGFSTSTDLVSNGSPNFQIQIGSANPAIIAINQNETITDLKDKINSLGLDVKASVVQTTSNSDWALIIQGTKTGEGNEVQITDLDIAIYDPVENPNLRLDPASNSTFLIDEIEYKRSTNGFIEDVIEGVTLNLYKASPNITQTISVTKGTDVSSEAINTLIVAYNDVMTTYKAMTGNSSNSDKPGSFANSPSTLAFINQIKEGFAKGISYTLNDERKTMSLSTLGIDLDLKGKAVFNSSSFAKASESGLRDTLANGVIMGYVSNTSNLSTFITSLVKSDGVLSGQIDSEKVAKNIMTRRQDDLQIRLNSIQNNLITQYSALNALLFQLSSTSNSLTSALDALTNSQKNN